MLGSNHNILFRSLRFCKKRINIFLKVPFIQATSILPIDGYIHLLISPLFRIKYGEFSNFSKRGKEPLLRIKGSNNIGKVKAFTKMIIGGFHLPPHVVFVPILLSAKSFLKRGKNIFLLEFSITLHNLFGSKRRRRHFESSPCLPDLPGNINVINPYVLPQETFFLREIDIFYMYQNPVLIAQSFGQGVKMFPKILLRPNTISPQYRHIDLMFLHDFLSVWVPCNTGKEI